MLGRFSMQSEARLRRRPVSQRISSEFFTVVFYGAKNFTVKPRNCAQRGANAKSWKQVASATHQGQIILSSGNHKRFKRDFTIL
jgi:hypothetical protein